MTSPIKNPTAFRPVSGLGSVILVSNLPIVDNAAHLPIVDNAAHLPVITNPTVTRPKNATVWSATG